MAKLRSWLAPRGRPLRWALPVTVLALVLLLQSLAPHWADRAEAWTVDTRFLLRGPEQPHSPIIIVAVDEDSVQLMGENYGGENVRTWPRSRWAELVGAIASGGPRVIGLDVVFDTPGWDEGGDDALARALAEAGNVVLSAHVLQSGGETYQTVTLSPPLAPLAASAAGVGIANLPVDSDGAIRSSIPLYTYNEKTYPSFALATAVLFSGQRISMTENDLAGLSIHSRGPEGTFTTIPVYRVMMPDLAEAVDPAVLRDAIVLVGYTTQLEQDRHPAPFAGRSGMPGVEIQANAVDTLLAGDWLHRPPAWLPLLLVGVAGLAALAALNLRRAGWGVTALLGGLALYGAAGLALFVRADFLLPLVAPVTAALLVGGATLTERMLFAERDKRRLRQRFAGVMSPERLQAVLDRWETLLETERPTKEAAVLFADVRGFTNATETLMRQGRSPEMVRFLSAYLDAMAEAVFAEGGVIYDVIGDGLMILFGLPEPLPDYALRAARAALRMARATEGLQELWPLRDQRPMGMGIGVHCGRVVDAVVGRGRRVNYAVIGDPVNTAARIQDHCKKVMEIPPPPGSQVPPTVTILLSAAIYEQVRERVSADESVPPFEARGKSEPLRVVRLMGMRET